jgi:hypothetical protein
MKQLAAVVQVILLLHNADSILQQQMLISPDSSTST